MPRIVSCQFRRVCSSSRSKSNARYQSFKGKTALSIFCGMSQADMSCSSVGSVFIAATACRLFAAAFDCFGNGEQD